MKEIEERLASFPPAQSAALTTIRSTLRSLLPAATEDMSWGMPTFRSEGIIVLSFLGFTEHNSLFPGPEVQKEVGSLLDGYDTTKGTIHLPRDSAPTKAFLKELVEARIRIINRSYPKKSGEFLELYSNGVLKAKGKYKDGQMHGSWSFYRKDGTIMRSGAFKAGRQVGNWVTYDSSGKPYKTTAMG